MKYAEYKEQKQKEFDALPIFWAFGKEQFKEAMEARGLTAKDTDKIYSLGAGGYYLKTDAQLIHDYMNKPDEMAELMQDYDFAKDAIYEEMCNHEFSINDQGNWDVCNCYYGDRLYGKEEREKYFDAMNWSETTRRAWKDAQARYYRDAEANDWF